MQPLLERDLAQHRIRRHETVDPLHAEQVERHGQLHCVKGAKAVRGAIPEQQRLGQPKVPHKESRHLQDFFLNVTQYARSSQSQLSRPNLSDAHFEAECGNSLHERKAGNAESSVGLGKQSRDCGTAGFEMVTLYQRACVKEVLRHLVVTTLGNHKVG